MSVAIDLIASVIIAGYVLLMGLRLNMDLSSTAVASTTNVNVQEAMAEVANTFELDLKKIGYGLPDPSAAIAVADSNRLRFRSDMNRDGVTDSVEWYVGNPLPQYTDRVVRMLYRKYNNGTPLLVATCVITFRLKYLDQDGTVTTSLTNIALIETTLEISSPYKVADQVNPEVQEYITTLWRQSRVASRNLKRHG